MKSATLPKDFPNNSAAWEELIAEAPGEDRQPTAEEGERWEKAVIARSLPELREKLAKRRGAGRKPLKVPTTVRFDPEILEFFRATGPGWQTRMNNVLLDWLRKHRS